MTGHKNKLKSIVMSLMVSPKSLPWTKCKAIDGFVDQAWLPWIVPFTMDGTLNNLVKLLTHTMHSAMDGLIPDQGMNFTTGYDGTNPCNNFRLKIIHSENCFYTACYECTNSLRYIYISLSLWRLFGRKLLITNS